MKILDLYCCAGGASHGYHLAGLEVTGVDIAPQKRYPYPFIQADAIDFLRAHGHQFDAIHASPPCQAYTSLAAINPGHDHPRLIEPTRLALQQSGKPYILENVPGAPLLDPIKLCGSSFSLRVRRHRLFESNIPLLSLPCRHREQGRPIGVYGNRGSQPLRHSPHGGSFIRARSTTEARAIMGIDWMVWHELTQAIPPAYTLFLGTQLLTYLHHTKGQAA